jgi:8-oxo-dGTP pyrophosphatase MutT (NUDIX family)
MRAKDLANDTTDNDALIWTERSSRKLESFRIFSVSESLCVSPEGEQKPFMVIDTHDWAMVMPIIKRPLEKRSLQGGLRGGDAGGGTGDGEIQGDFVMVKQWRHGARCLCVEFPGGVIEDGEDAAAGAARELREETGYTAGRMTELAVMSPNPAIMSNHIHFFLAEDLTPTGKLQLDEDEFVNTSLVPVEDVIRNMGKAPYTHALTAAALSFFLAIKHSEP